MANWGGKNHDDIITFLEFIGYEATYLTFMLEG